MESPKLWTIWITTVKVTGGLSVERFLEFEVRRSVLSGSFANGSFCKNIAQSAIFQYFYRGLSSAVFPHSSPTVVTHCLALRTFLSWKTKTNQEGRTFSGLGVSLVKAKYWNCPSGPQRETFTGLLNTIWHHYMSTHWGWCQHTVKVLMADPGVTVSTTTPIKCSLHSKLNAQVVMCWTISWPWPVTSWSLRQLSGNWTRPRNSPTHNPINKELFLHLGFCTD